MFIKEMKFEEFRMCGNVLNTIRHYNEGKIMAKMQLAPTQLGPKREKCFQVSIDIHEGLPNNRWGKQIGHQFEILSINGTPLDKYDPKLERDLGSYPNEKFQIDKKYLPWVLSAIEFFISIRDELF